MNKKRFGSLSVRHWAMIFALAALTAVYVTRSDGSGLMAATTTRELPVYNVDTEEKVLSISFDAAWGNANTEGILNILDQYGVKTNFFLVGFWAEKYPELVAELQARGHEVGNHSATHPHMSKLSDSQIREELKRCSDLVQSVTGKPTTLFRPPSRPSTWRRPFSSPLLSSAVVMVTFPSAKLRHLLKMGIRKPRPVWAEADYKIIFYAVCLFSSSANRLTAFSLYLNVCTCLLE